MGEGIHVSKIRGALHFNAGERVLDDFFIQFDTHRVAGFAHGEQHGGGAERGWQTRGLLSGHSIE